MPARPRIEFAGAQADAVKDQTRYLDIEGAFRAAKTTIGLWKVLLSCLANPGITWMISRWTDDATFSLLRPVWRNICAHANVPLTWHADESYDRLDNGSIVYVRGLKASEETNRYGKFRGLTLAGIYWDQPEEGPRDVFLELSGRLSQRGFPQQLILTPNPPDDDHWIAKEFPEDNHYVDRKYLRLSVYDNAHNLDPAFIRGLEQTYPVGHAKHGPAILGIRGLNVKGDPVYKGVFRRDLHVHATEMNPRLPLLEVYDFGKHHPCVLWTQFDPWGGWTWLGGIMGRDLFIEDFAPMVQRYRREWFPNPMDIHWACDPAGSHQNSQGTMLNGVKVLNQHDVFPRWIDNSNQPAIRRGAIERMAGFLRRRTVHGEAFALDDKRWLVVDERQSEFKPFAAQAFEAGYVWDERQRTTAGGKSITVPLKDGWFEHVMNCGEYTELNFGQGQQTVVQMERTAERMANAAVRRAQRDPERVTLRGTARGPSRGGY